MLDAPERAGNYPESSVSCLTLYALAKAIRKGYTHCVTKVELDSVYRCIIEQFIVTIHGQPIVTKCCQVAGLGNTTQREGTFDYYMSEEPIIANDLKGTGAFLQAACEMER